jgi:hypothetical protein
MFVSDMNGERKVLPLRDAYLFGSARGLSLEVAEIQKKRIKDIKGVRSPSVRRGYIVELFEKHGLFDQFKKEHWPFGITKAGETSCRWYLKLRGEHEKRAH